MITVSPDFDLGRDKARIKDHRDAERQHATVQDLLNRLYGPKGRPLQVLADEVGMGKTFVALGVAWSVLAAVRAGRHGVDDLRGSLPAVLVLTPQNSALFRKWIREVGEFARRCMDSDRAAAAAWFAPVEVEHVDEFRRALDAKGKVLIAHTGVLARRTFRQHDLKRRFLLGILFRHWGNRIRVEERERLLRGAPDHWPGDPYRLTEVSTWEREQLAYTEDEALAALGRADTGFLEKCLGACKDLAQPYTHGRSEKFAAVESLLVEVHRQLAFATIRGAFPLVVVDEAHNWKNFANGYDRFAEHLAPRTRRLLLLTATPFQLHPHEMLRLLEAAEPIRPAWSRPEAEVRAASLREARQNLIGPVLARSADSSRKFARAWARLPSEVTTERLRAAWCAAELIGVRSELRGLAFRAGLVDDSAAADRIESAIAPFDPAIRELLREALRIYVHNADLSQELGEYVVRHRRHTDHRLFRVGAEYAEDPASAAKRPDRSALHAGPGIDVRGDGELPQYLLMRCVSEMKRQRRKGRRSSLGCALTGCYSTLLESAEGRNVRDELKSGTGRAYLELLLGMADRKNDPKHPKLAEVVEQALRAWRAGEKTLIFCFRTNTAHRIRDILDDRIKSELKRRRRTCLGREEALAALRGRLSGRDRDLVGLGLDRVLASLAKTGAPWSLEDLVLVPDDLVVVAREALEREVDLSGERPDRVFLHRATEHALALRLRERARGSAFQALLHAMAGPEWVERSYGLESGRSDEGEGEDAAHVDERGTDSVYPRRGTASPEEVADAAADLVARRERAVRAGQVPVLDAYARGPNLWIQSPDICRLVLDLTKGTSGPDWATRRLVMRALRRAALRESVLVRMLPDRSDREESGWGDLLVEAFHAPLPGQRESMAARIAVFLEDLRAASGDVTDRSTARGALLDATALRDQQFVRLVDGSTKSDIRDRVFAGFNTPLLPDVLVCTSVGQEGIDLHRHCRHVVHYDLAWNPAVLEQRTGRADRIGSKTFRERDLGCGDDGPFLEIGVPFLAGTYDERMYEELRLRAQTFEVLTGGDLAADHAEGQDDVRGAEGEERRLDLVPLPQEMVEELRVRLEVWRG